MDENTVTINGFIFEPINTKVFADHNGHCTLNINELFNNDKKIVKVGRMLSVKIYMMNKHQWSQYTYDQFNLIHQTLSN